MDKNDIVYRLFDSDAANALTNEDAREIDRLRAELETTKRHMAEDTRDIGALEDEVATLRAELAKAQEEKKAILELADLAASNRNEERDRAEAAESRIKELELALSGKTFSYDPDSYKKGLEDAELIASENCSINGHNDRYCASLIRDRIKEVNNER